MPIYEYFCEGCKGAFEESRKVHERLEPIACPVCGETTSTLIPSHGSFILKGAGWSGGHDPGNSHGP